MKWSKHERILTFVLWWEQKSWGWNEETKNKKNERIDWTGMIFFQCFFPKNGRQEHEDQGNMQREKLRSFYEDSSNIYVERMNKRRSS